MDNVVYVLHERDLQNNSIDILGVATSLEDADRMMQGYYGFFKLVEFRDVRDSGIEWVKRITLEGAFGYEYEVTLMDFSLNSI